MTDIDRPSPTLSDNDGHLYKLTLNDVVARFEAAGMPRSYRSVQRYCERGRLDCLKTDTPNGEQYFVTEASVVRAIKEMEQLWALKNNDGHVQPELATPSHVQPTASMQIQPDTASQRPTVSDNVEVRPTEKIEERVGESASDTPGQAQTGETGMSKYVSLLEKENDRLHNQLEVKDKQIDQLLERDRETNMLVASLQRMLSPLLGSGQSHEQRDTTYTEPRDTYHTPQGMGEQPQNHN